MFLKTFCLLSTGKINNVHREVEISVSQLLYHADAGTAYQKVHGSTAGPGDLRFEGSGVDGWNNCVFNSFGR